MVRTRFLLPVTIVLLLLVTAGASGTLAGPLPGGGTATTTLSSGGSVYVQYPGQYCMDKSGGEVYVPAQAPVPDGLSCTVNGFIPPLPTAIPGPSGSTPTSTPTASPSH